MVDSDCAALTASTFEGKAFMRRQHLVFLAIAAAVLLIGVAVFDASSGWLFAAAFLVLCPLMMLMMMGGMHRGGHGGEGQRRGGRLRDDNRPTAGSDSP